MNFTYDFTEVCSWGPKQQHSNIGSDNGLVPTKWQTSIWTNSGYFTDTYTMIYASPGHNELILSHLQFDI